ncbi:MAG TPA: sulfate permease [Draconibacterium sp.]|nr:sulfate permease [Draconibacterium sp.]
MKNQKSGSTEKSIPGGKTKLKEMLHSYLPIMEWGKDYTSKIAVNDLVVAVIVTIMLIPQSLAYAQLAGLPPEVGLYASMAPLVIYAIFGTSRTLSVGPIATSSLMTLAAVTPIVAVGTPEYLGAVIALATITGLVLIVLGLLKLGFIANFMSFPVMAGLGTAVGLQIATSQLSPILGVSLEGESFLQMMISLLKNFSQISVITAAIGISCVIFLLLVKQYLATLLIGAGMNKKLAGILAKMGPVIAIIITIVVVSGLGLDKQGVKIVGEVPKGLPTPVLPSFDLKLWSQLVTPAILIAILTYVGSLTVAQTLAAKKRQQINPDQEFFALGAANIGAAISGGLPVAGGFSRSIVNFDAGAETPAAGVYTAVGIALVALFLTPLLFFLPNAALGATIFVAVLSMVNFKAVVKTFGYSKADGIAMALTIIIILTLGIIYGLIAGIGTSLAMYLYRTSKPHVAILGQVAGTQSFKNIERHEVVTSDRVVSMRIDESIYFPNAKFLESKINEIVASHHGLQHFVLNCSSVNSIDASGLESLKAINGRLKDAGISFHLAEIKGPIMDGLNKTKFPQEMKDRIHVTQYDAVYSIDPELAQKTMKSERKPDNI